MINDYMVSEGGRKTLKRKYNTKTQNIANAGKSLCPDWDSNSGAYVP